MVTSDWQSRRPILPMRPQHNTIRSTHYVFIPTPHASTTKTNREPTVLGRTRLPKMDQDRPQRTRGRSHQLLRVPLSTPHTVTGLVVIRHSPILSCLVRCFCFCFVSFRFIFLCFVRFCFALFASTLLSLL